MFPKRLTLLLLIAVITLSTAACSSVQRPDPPPDDAGEDNFYSHVYKDPEPEPEQPELEALNTGGELSRDALVSFLDLGPPALLRNVQLYPVLEGNHFVGFEIQSFFPKHHQLQRVDLRRGDVVVAINSVRIERPDDLFRVWEDLRTAPRLQVDFIRGQTLQTYTWEIVDTTDTLGLAH